MYHEYDLRVSLILGGVAFQQESRVLPGVPGESLSEPSEPRRLASWLLEPTVPLTVPNSFNHLLQKVFPRFFLRREKFE
jgi:hypothetical protein